MNLGINDEVSTLKKVIIHRPDDGVEWVTPDKAIEYLYDDIVFLKKMKEEHDVFTQVLRAFLGKENVIDIQDLLIEILNIPKVKSDLVNAVCQFENNVHLVQKLVALSPKYLAYTLLTGIDYKTKNQIFPPIANYLFCRDIGVFIKDNLLHCEASKDARYRESLISRFVFRNASLFSNNPLIELSSTNVFLDRLTNNKKHFAIEGGDVMMVHPDHLLIGHSERTNLAAIEKFAQLLFERKVVKYISRIDMPKERYCMHLDTILTFIDHGVCVGFEELLISHRMPVTTYHNSIDNQSQFHCLKDLLHFIFPILHFIPCAGGVSPYAAREQWTDGCNLFTLKPGVAVAYDRNVRTAKTLKENGYQLLSAKKLLKAYKNGSLNTAELEKTIILIPSNELSRARGGTHCLTFPISRI